MAGRRGGRALDRGHRARILGSSVRISPCSMRDRPSGRPEGPPGGSPDGRHRRGAQPKPQESAMPLLEIAQPDGRVPDPARRRSRRSMRSILRSIRARSWRSSANSARARACPMLAVMGLLPWTARVSADRLAFDGQDLRAPVARRAPPDPGQGHGDDLPGADDVLESVLHGRLSADRGDPRARGRSRQRGARSGQSSCSIRSASLRPPPACAPSRTSSRAA